MADDHFMVHSQSHCTDLQFVQVAPRKLKVPAWSLTSHFGLTLTSITHFSHFSGRGVGWGEVVVGLSSISLFHQPPPLFLRKSVISPSLLPASPKPYWTGVSVRRSSAASAGSFASTGWTWVCPAFVLPSVSRMPPIQYELYSSGERKSG